MRNLMICSAVAATYVVGGAVSALAAQRMVLGEYWTNNG